MGKREELVRVAQSYVGAKQGSAQHKKLVDVFNNYGKSYKDERGNYTCAWCAIAASSWANIANIPEAIMPRTYNCGRMITQAQKRGIWVENDNYRPTAGDYVIFYWNAPNGNCNSGASHIGVVEKVVGNTITTIEGNMGNPSHVGRRSFPVGYKYIRGFIVPKYGTTVKVHYTGLIPTANVKRGSKGENVNRVQNFANWYFGKKVLTVDGECGVKTVAIIKEIQGYYKLAQDGVAGPLFRNLMKTVTR